MHLRHFKHPILFALCAACTAQPEPPEFPISLSSIGPVEQVVKISGDGVYKLEFQFSRNGIAFEEMKKLIGAAHVCQAKEPCSAGIMVPVSWSIRSTKSGQIAAAGQAETIDSSGWSQAFVARHIGSASLERGSYSLKIEILRGVPELAHLKTTVAIRLPLK